MTAPPKRILAILRVGDVALKILAFGEGPNPRIMGSLEKLVDPTILKENPALAHTFTPTDISAIKKLAEEAEDAFFNYQSMILTPVDPNKAPEGTPPDETKEEESD